MHMPDFCPPIEVLSLRLNEQLQDEQVGNAGAPMVALECDMLPEPPELVVT